MVQPHELGPFFEDFTVGAEVRPLPTLTVTEADNTAYRAVTGDQHALTADQGLHRAVGGEGVLANPGLVAHISVGQTTNATRRAIANLYYRSVRILRPVRVGETLRTSTTVLGKRSSSPKDGQHRGKVWLGITTVGDDGECMRYERCALVPAHGTGPEATDEIPGPSDPTPLPDLVPLLPTWDLAPLERTEWPAGETRVDPLRDHVDLAAPFARLTFNQAAVHRDRTLPASGRRLVYGGHVQALAQASLSRILPGLAQVVAWDGCDHVGPAFEDDLLEFSHQLLETFDVPGGRLLRLAVTGVTVDGGAGEVLRWTPVVFAP
ncbi:MAG: MaoC/PaaZ C-terminal domain-containing protein [Ilumatobacteraceae bacterium]